MNHTAYPTLFETENHNCLDGWTRPDIVAYVYKNSYMIPTSINLSKLSELLTRELGMERDGDIFHEARDGWLDYFDGEWFLCRNKRVLWLANPEYLDLVVAAQLSYKA